MSHCCRRLLSWPVPTIVLGWCLVLPVSVSAAFPPAPVTQSQRGMVVSAQPLASQAGVQMLARGGNAVDAAVATALAISVVEPAAAGLGGGGFLLLYREQGNEILALDFRERAPRRASRGMYLDREGNINSRASLDGHLAVAVPGTVAGLYAAHQRYGRLPWAALVQPAIGYAERGFVISPRLASFLSARNPVLSQNPAARAIFTRGGQPLRAGELLVQTDLGRTLRQIAQHPGGFYTGEIAAKIAADMVTQGGLIDGADLQAYRPRWRTPVCGPFRQYQVCSMPPPSSGGVGLLQTLNLLGGTDFPTLGWQTPAALQVLAGAMQITYADRAAWLGDPDFARVPAATLISPAYAQLRQPELDSRRARAATEVRAVDAATLEHLQLQRPQSPNTSHLTVVDEQRNTVSLTFTINGRFGAGVVAAGTGIVLNNEMNDFALNPGVPNQSGPYLSTGPGSEANAIAPGKTPLSSMTPTIVTERGQLRLALGSPGGSTIITTCVQLLLNVLVYGQDVGTAVAAPRIHQQWFPDKLYLERGGFETGVIQTLKRQGNTVEEGAPWGNANLILRTPGDWLQGAADPRGEGAALGFETPK